VNAMKYVTTPIEVDAEQVTEQMLLDCLINGTDGPFGLRASGNFHPEERKLYRGYFNGPYEQVTSSRFHAGVGCWIIRFADGSLGISDDESFKRRYHLKPDGGAL
jgi:hypothetical protein